MDNEGNTPLQLAASHCCSLVVGLLLMDKRAKSDMVNHQGHRAYDIAKHRQALAYNILPADKATTNSRKQNVPAVKVCDSLFGVLIWSSFSLVHTLLSFFSSYQAVDGRIGIGESMEASGDNVKHSTEVLDSHSKKSREPNLYGMVRDAYIELPKNLSLSFEVFLLIANTLHLNIFKIISIFLTYRCRRYRSYLRFITFMSSVLPLLVAPSLKIVSG